MNLEMAVGGIKEYIYLIGLVIYVGAMFPLFLLYQQSPGNTYTLIPTLTWISAFGCFLFMVQLFAGALVNSAPKKQESESKSTT